MPRPPLKDIVMTEPKIEVLEERVKHLEDLMRDHIAEDAKRLAAIEGKLDTVLITMAQYRGVIGGLLLAGSAIGAFVTYIINYLGRG